MSVAVGLYKTELILRTARPGTLSRARKVGQILLFCPSNGTVTWAADSPARRAGRVAAAVNSNDSDSDDWVNQEADRLAKQPVCLM